MFTRFLVSFAVALGTSLLCLTQSQAQIRIVLPPIPDTPVYVPQTSFTRVARPTPTPLPAIAANTKPAPRAKFEPDKDAVYHGASLPDTWSEDGLRRQIMLYNAAAGKHISVITWFASAYEQGRLTSWRQNYSYSLERIKRLGAISLIKFSTQDYAYASTGKMAGLKEIAGGTWDDYFKEAANTLHDFNSPVFLSIDHEMNGTWYPYSQAYPGSNTTAADYVAAWKHIYTIFQQQGATNVAFVWSPNVPDVGGVPYASYYPGDTFVDWIGVSFYSGNTMSGMDAIYRKYSPIKPFFITEWATAPEKNKYNSLFPGEVDWVKQFFAALATRYPRVKAISWFNWKNGDGDYRLTRVADQTDEYAQDIAAPRYLDSPIGQPGQSTPSNQPETPRLVVTPNEPVFREKAVAPPPVATAPRVVAPKAEKVPTERVGTETVRVTR